jgi:excisionase family DNA binding protein
LTVSPLPDSSVDQLPDLLTIEEAAQVLRIGRTAAYELARRFRATDGQDGMPVIAIGRQLRVPRARLEAWIGAELETGLRPSTARAVNAIAAADVSHESATTPIAITATRNRRRSNRGTDNQLDLFNVTDAS